MKILITILSRKGSKGLPNKHLLSFNGKPLIEWTMLDARDFARNNGGDVVVASGSPFILGMAKGFGLAAIARNPKYATDKAGKVDAIRDVWINKENETHSPIYDCIIDLDATNPCRTIEDIENAFRIFCDKRPKTLFSSVKSKKSPYFNMIQKAAGKIRLASEVAAMSASIRGSYKFLPFLTRQDAPEAFDLNSNIYIYDAKWLADKNNKSVITDNSEIYLMPEWTRVDIDSEVDFKIAQYLHANYILRKKDGDVQSKKQDCSGSGWPGSDRVCGHGCATQARGIYFND